MWSHVLYVKLDIIHLFRYLKIAYHVQPTVLLVQHHRQIVMYVCQLLLKQDLLHVNVILQIKNINLDRYVNHANNLILFVLIVKWFLLLVLFVMHVFLDIMQIY